MAMTPTHDTNTNKDQPTSTPTPEREPLTTKPAHTPATRNRRHRNAVRVFPGSVRLPGRAKGGTSHQDIFFCAVFIGKIFECFCIQWRHKTMDHPVELRTFFRACFGAWHSRDMQSPCCLSRFDAISTTRSAANGSVKRTVNW